MSRVDKTAQRKAATKRATARARWTARQLRRKRCMSCGREPIAKGSARFGLKCLRRDAARKREARGHRAWRAGRPGRPPLGARVAA